MEDYILLPEKTIRYKEIKQIEESQYLFEIYKRPFLFGLIGKKRWVLALATTDFDLGYIYSKHLVFK